MRRAVLVCATVVAAVVGCPVALAAPQCGGFGATLDTGQTCHLHTAAAGYTVDMRFPADYPDPQPLFGYLAAQRDQFLDYVQSVAAPDRAAPYELSVSSKVYRSGPTETGTDSVVLWVGQDVGVHPVTSVRTFTFDLGTRRPVTFDTLFRPGSAPLDVIYPAVRRELQKAWGAETLAPLRDGLDPATYQNFAITDQAVVFYFDQDQLLGQNEGPLQVVVPREELASLLA
ncbi:RsiV family protein [Mycobacterium sp. NBC_00419]|uniref:esterase n=1 Tax=Mycobacterium sp. NBC_00419 TaxID=2975989 RepID=UPI002E1E3F8F